MAAAALVEDPTVLFNPAAAEEEEEVGEEEEYDPTARSCGWCYMVLPRSVADDDDDDSDEAKTSTTTPCPHCPRLYCSPACYRCDLSTHAFWCGKVGEKGVDFDVCHIAGKGLGVITKRAFERGEKILAERPVMTTTNVVKYPTTIDDQDDDPDHYPAHTEEEEAKTNECIRVAAMALTPLDGDLEDKVNNNGVSLGLQDAEASQLQAQGDALPETAGLFLTFSRVNHDCLGNADHYFDYQHGVELLVANDTIPAYTEVTFPYTRTGKDRLSDLNWRGFNCTCSACQTPALDWKVNQMSALDIEVVQLGAQRADVDRAKAVEMAYTLLHLYDEVNASCRDYARIHYDLFQILVARENSLDQAQHHMIQAYQYALSFCGYEGHETVLRYKEYVDHPELHGNYRVID